MPSPGITAMRAMAGEIRPGGRLSPGRGTPSRLDDEDAARAVGDAHERIRARRRAVERHDPRGARLDEWRAAELARLGEEGAGLGRERRRGECDGVRAVGDRGEADNVARACTY